MPADSNSATDGSHHDRVTVRECLVQAIILTALLAVVYPGTFLRGELIVPGSHYFNYPPWSAHTPADFDPIANETTIDFMMHFQLYYALTKEAFDQGEWPLWNPVQNLGMPLLANYQSRVLYPPALLYALLDLNLATTFYMLLKAWLCGATAYACGRGLGMSRVGARFLSVAWMLAGYNMLWLYWPLPDVAAWLPIVFLGAEWAAQAKYRKAFFAIAAGGTLMLLAGHPETAFTMGVGVGAYLVMRLALARKRPSEWGRALGIAALAWVPALIVCAAQLIPFAEYVANSHAYGARAGGDAWIRHTGVRALIALFVPRYFGSNVFDNFWGWPETLNATDVSALYPGMIVWIGILALLATAGWKGLAGRRAMALIVPSVFCVMLATNMPLLEWFHMLPLMNSLWRNYWVAFPLFALPVLGAMGVDRWFSSKSLTSESRRLLMGAVGLLLCAILLQRLVDYLGPPLLESGESGYAYGQIGLAVLLGVGGLVLFVVCRNRPRLAGILVTLLLVLDLGEAARGLHPTSPRAHLEVETELIPALNALPQPSRVLQFSLNVPSGFLPAYGVEQLLGAEFLYPERPKRFFEETNALRIWEKMEPVCAVDHQLWAEGSLRGHPHAADLELVTTLDGVDVYRNPDALPRAYLMNHLEVAADPDALFARMAQPDFDPAHTAITEADFGVAPLTGNGDPGRATVVERGPGSMRIDVDADQAAVLVVSEAFYPGWKARIDGEAAELFPVYYALRGMNVAAGHHVVDMTYEPASFRIGFIISMLGMAMGSLGAGILLLRIAARPSR